MIIHVVGSGETLWSIANRYGSSIQQIASVNELPNPDQLVIGQALVIPIAATHHTVRSGETLWHIAQRFGVPINSIIQANHLTNPAMINIGTVLIIPPRTHTVQAGESLGQIAQFYGTTVQDILKINQIQQANMIFIGSVLIIPFPKRPVDVNAYVLNMGETGAKEVQRCRSTSYLYIPFCLHYEGRWRAWVA